MMEYGWRVVQPSAARVKHPLNEDGKPVCGTESIAVSTLIISAAPRAFHANIVKRLMALPDCAVCTRREGKRADPLKMNFSTPADRLVVESLCRQRDALRAAVEVAITANVSPELKVTLESALAVN